MLELQYNEGVLRAAKIDFERPLNSELHLTLMNNIPLEESGINLLTGLGLKVVIERTGQQKVAMYCDKYM